MSENENGTINSINLARAAANKLALHGQSKDIKEASGAIFALCNVVTTLLGRIEELEAKTKE